ncbi:MAG TPA: carbohydrate-binding family 9-like protein [Armatimonadota bacterium]|jgi:hypothetical protein
MNWIYVAVACMLLTSLASAAVHWEYPPPVMPDLPTYDCYQAAEPPVLDGNLDDACWQGIPAIKLHRCVSGIGPTQPTSVKVIWHGDYLYFAWKVSEFDIEDHNQKRNDAVFGEACVEHFLQAPAGFPDYPTGTSRYAEFDISPTGVIWDGRIENPYDFTKPVEHRMLMKVDPSFDPEDVKVASHLNGTVNDPSHKDYGWTMEVQIPLNGPPGGHTPTPGEVWRMNLYRIHGWNQPDRELQSWSVVGVGNFHVPQRFGNLRFQGPLPAAK